MLSTFQVAPSQTQITEGQSMSFSIQRLDGLEFAEDVPYQFVADQADLTHPDDYWQYNMYGSATGAQGVLHFAENAHSGYLSVGFYEDTLAEGAANFALILAPAGGSPITTTIPFVDNDIPAPEIEVFDAGNSSLYDGMSYVYLPTLALGQSTEYILRVRNAGDADLSLTPGGYNLPSDVTVAPGYSTVLAPGAETNLTLIFTPTSTGYYWRDVGLDNNDADENPFNVQFYSHVAQPTVNVWATAETDAAAEAGPTPRVFTLHRDNAQGDLTTQFIMQGAADPYSDYTLSAAASALPEWTPGSPTGHVNLPTYPAAMSHTVVFRAGETTLPITLTPIDDTVFNEGTEQAQLTPQWSSAYTITQATATIAIEENDLPPEAQDDEYFTRSRPGLTLVSL